MRAYWPAQALGARVISYDDLREADLPTEGVIIWQKKANANVIKKARHLRHVWDVCDPAWWWNPGQSRAVADAVDAVVCSSAALASDFDGWYKSADAPDINSALPVVTIPDRLDLLQFPSCRSHESRRPARLIWFGVAVNRIALLSALANLERLVANGNQIELTIFDDRPDQPWLMTDDFPIYHVQWSVTHENQVLSNHDIALLPPYPGPWGRVKSNNKSLTAWACGLPVATGDNYSTLRELVRSYHARRAEAGTGFQLLIDQYTIDKSVADWLGLLGH